MSDEFFFSSSILKKRMPKSAEKKPEKKETKKRAPTDHAGTSVDKLKKSLDISAGTKSSGVLASILTEQLQLIVTEATKLKATTCMLGTVEAAVKLAGLGKYHDAGTAAVTKIGKEDKKTAGLSKSTQAGVSVSVSWVASHLRSCAKRLSANSAVYVAGVLSALMADFMKKADELKKKGVERLTTREAQLALREMGLPGTVVAGGVVPFIHPALLPKKPEPEQ